MPLCCIRTHGSVAFRHVAARVAGASFGQRGVTLPAGRVCLMVAARCRGRYRANCVTGARSGGGQRRLPPPAHTRRTKTVRPDTVRSSVSHKDVQSDADAAVARPVSHHRQRVIPIPNRFRCQPTHFLPLLILLIAGRTPRDWSTVCLSELQPRIPPATIQERRTAAVVWLRFLSSLRRRV